MKPLLPFSDPIDVPLPARSKRILKCLHVRSNELVTLWNATIKQVNILIRLHPAHARILVEGFARVLKNTVTQPVLIRPFLPRIADKLQRLALLKPEAMARIEAAIDAELHDIAGDPGDPVAAAGNRA